jgi:thiamine-monophosphate kinase
VSDGLLGDLRHVLKRSGSGSGTDGQPLGAVIEADALPRSPLMREQTEALQLECTLAGGDDYELLFTAAPADHERVRQAGERSATGVRRIGRITADGGTAVVGRDGQRLATPWASFDHFVA